MHNLLFCVHALCMNNVTNTLLLVSSPVRRRVVQYTQTLTGRQSGIRSVTDHDGSSPFVSSQETWKIFMAVLWSGVLSRYGVG